MVAEGFGGRFPGAAPELTGGEGGGGGGVGPPEREGAGF